MTLFRVTSATTARQLPPREGRPQTRADHLELIDLATGEPHSAIAYIPMNKPLMSAGMTIEGDLGETDGWDADRLRFRFARSTGAPSSQQPLPAAAPAPPAAAAARSGERERRIERMHAQEMALRYAALRAPLAELTLVDIAELATAFERDVDAPAPIARDYFARSTPLDPGPQDDLADAARTAARVNPGYTYQGD